MELSFLSLLEKLIIKKSFSKFSSLQLVSLPRLTELSISNDCFNGNTKELLDIHDLPQLSMISIDNSCFMLYRGLRIINNPNLTSFQCSKYCFNSGNGVLTIKNNTLLNQIVVTSHSMSCYSVDWNGMIALFMLNRSSFIEVYFYWWNRWLCILECKIIWVRWLSSAHITYDQLELFCKSISILSYKYDSYHFSNRPPTFVFCLYRWFMF